MLEKKMVVIFLFMAIDVVAGDHKDGGLLAGSNGQKYSNRYWGAVKREGVIGQQSLNRCGWCDQNACCYQYGCDGSCQFQFLPVFGISEWPTNGGAASVGTNSEQGKRFKAKKLSDLKDLDVDDVDGQGLLHYYVGRGNFKIVRFLLKEGVDVNRVDGKGQHVVEVLACRVLTPKHQGSDFRIVTRRVASMLVRYGKPNFDETSYNSTKLSHLLVRCVDSTSLQYLVEKGLNLKVKNDKGYTPLHEWCIDRMNSDTVQEGDGNFVLTLLKKGGYRGKDLGPLISLYNKKETTLVDFFQDRNQGGRFDKVIVDIEKRMKS